MHYIMILHYHLKLFTNQFFTHETYFNQKLSNNNTKAIVQNNRQFFSFLSFLIFSIVLNVRYFCFQKLCNRDVHNVTYT